MDFIEPCFGTGHNLSLICQMTSEDIKHQLIIIISHLFNSLWYKGVGGDREGVRVRTNLTTADKGHPSLHHMFRGGRWGWGETQCIPALRPLTHVSHPPLQQCVVLGCVCWGGGGEAAECEGVRWTTPDTGHPPSPPVW